MKIIISLLLMITGQVVFAGDGEGSGNEPENTSSTPMKQVCIQMNDERAKIHCTIVAFNTITDN